MSDVAIRVENLSKKFHLGTGSGPAYHRLTEAASGIPRMFWQAGRSLFSKGKRSHSSETTTPTDFWALRDVSFEVKQGEVVGIIGRNGAGKSTLLKILSRITEPTSGRFGVRGRVASLLEVGTGFHPELTGRENIYVSGVTLGMTRAEVKKRFDEIVDFSGVEKFLDTPTKHYSSGMQVRLGFAVAAHLESEILIIDEVLAVGDAEFQRKCIGRLKMVSSSGRCVLLVSHNINSVQELCHSALILERGHLTNRGECQAILKRYDESVGVRNSQDIQHREDRRGNRVAMFRKLEILNEHFESKGAVACGSTVNLRVEIAVSTPTAIELTIGVDDRASARITLISTMFHRPQKLFLEQGRHSIVFSIPRLPLLPGNYGLTLFMTANENIADWIVNAANIEVIAGYFYESGRLPPEGQGSILIDHSILAIEACA